jgi:hypothetical protein
MLRSCYSTTCYFFKPGGTPLPIRWYFVDDAAPWLPFPTVFNSNNWAERSLIGADQAGELTGVSRPYQKGQAPGGPLSFYPCGDADDFMGNGEPASGSDRAWVLPSCCTTFKFLINNAVAFIDSYQASFNGVALPYIYDGAFQSQEFAIVEVSNWYSAFNFPDSGWELDLFSGSVPDDADNLSDFALLTNPSETTGNCVFNQDGYIYEDPLIVSMDADFLPVTFEGSDLIGTYPIYANGWVVSDNLGGVLAWAYFALGPIPIEFTSDSDTLSLTLTMGCFYAFT